MGVRWHCGDDYIFISRGDCDKYNEYKIIVPDGICGGYIDMVRLNNDIDLVINDEGKIHNLHTNGTCINDNGRVADYICGNILCVRHHDDEFDFILESDIAVVF